MDRMKHIVLVTSSYPDEGFLPGQEAAGAFVADFADALSRYVKTTVVAPGMRACSNEEGALQVRRFKVPFLPLSLLKFGQPKHWYAILKTLRSGQKTLESVLNEDRVDHVFALWVLPSGYWAEMSCQKRGVPFTTWALGSDIWSFGANPLGRLVLRRVLRASRLRFADGIALAKDVEAISGGLRCDFLPSSRNCILPEQKRLAEAPPYNFAFLGRWHRNKGVDLLLESVSSLPEFAWNGIREIRICGGGPLEKVVTEQCTRLRRAGRPVVQRGYLDRKEAVKLLAWTDYVLIPSRIESIPVIFSDAMQCLCPVITTPVGDLHRLIGQYKVGITASSACADAFSNAIISGLGKNISEYANALDLTRKEFNINMIARQTLTRLTKNNKTY